MNPILHKTDLPPKGTRLCDMTPAQRETLPPGTRLAPLSVVCQYTLTKNIDGRWYDERGGFVDILEGISERTILSYPTLTLTPSDLEPPKVVTSPYYPGVSFMAVPSEPFPAASYDALLGARKALNEIGAAVGLPEWSDPDRVARAASARITSLEKDVGAAAYRAQVSVSKADAERDWLMKDLLLHTGATEAEVRDCMSRPGHMPVVGHHMGVEIRRRFQVEVERDYAQARVRELERDLANARGAKAGQEVVLAGRVRELERERDQARKDFAEAYSATNHAVLRAVPLESLLDEVARRARLGAK